MSFAADLKREIITNEYSDESLKAELYGILKLKAELILSFNKLSLAIKTTSLNLTRRIVYIIKKIYKQNVDIVSKERTNLDYKKVYILTISDDITLILKDLDIIDNEYNFYLSVSNKYDEFVEDVVRGMFLAVGSVNDPDSTRYHLELSCNEEQESSYLMEKLNEYGIEGKLSTRRGKYIYYLKKGEQIGDFLKLIGSTSLLFEFENIRIKKDLNNVVNRVINCEIANSTKVKASCDAQLENIRIIQEYKGFDDLSVRLMEAITLRVKFPESSLQELSDESLEVIGRYISKSGISHCMKDIEVLAKSLINENLRKK
jgi:DNA-binding protein WhiA